MAETEERELGSSADALAVKELSNNASPLKPFVNVFILYALLIEVVEIPTPEWDDMSTNWCPRSDSNRHWKDFKLQSTRTGRTKEY